MGNPSVTCVIINKDERAVARTLEALEQENRSFDEHAEIVVVDASQGRLDDIYHQFASVRIERFIAPVGVAVSIPHQRNRGIASATTPTVVFIDAGCKPRPGWLRAITGALDAGESVAAGRTLSTAAGVNTYEARSARDDQEYLLESPTINLAFRREVALAVGGFDEAFEYGSDVDFSWRLVDAGHRIRYVPDAVVETDWGTWRRQLRRSFVYGKARARLYRKHRAKRREVFRRDPVAVVYPLFLLGSPVALIWPWYLLLLVVPIWRNRRIGGLLATVDHLVYGAGVLVELREAVGVRQ